MLELLNEEIPRYERALREGSELELMTELEAETEALARTLGHRPDIDTDGQTAPSLGKQTLPKEFRLHI
jgi:hypothetical protein